jgi:chemotaxis protein CheZ
MAEPRKIFRIEESVAARPARGGKAVPGLARQPDTMQAEILQAIGALRLELKAPSAATAASPRTRTAQLDEEAAHLSRIAHELDAVVTGTNEATQKILAAAEEIDQAANNLSAALKGKIEQGAAQDIRDQVIRIFEACNFQDLIGQRVGKVLATLTAIEDRVERVLADIKNLAPAPAKTAQYLHGPRLDTDRGHVTQAEIDAVFRG